MNRRTFCALTGVSIASGLLAKIARAAEAVELENIINVKLDSTVVGAIQSVNLLPGKGLHGGLRARIIRTRINKRFLPDIFARGHIHVRSQKAPLQIEVLRKENNITINEAKLNNVWLYGNEGYLYSVGEIVIFENFVVEFESLTNLSPNK